MSNRSRAPDNPAAEQSASTPRDLAQEPMTILPPPGGVQGFKFSPQNATAPTPINLSAPAKPKRQRDLPVEEFAAALDQAAVDAAADGDAVRVSNPNAVAAKPKRQRDPTLMALGRIERILEELPRLSAVRIVRWLEHEYREIKSIEELG